MSWQRFYELKPRMVITSAVSITVLLPRPESARRTTRPFSLLGILIPMSWASGRRFSIIALIVGVIALVVAAVTFFSMQKAPSCVDNLQNQDEEGVDCGGSCSYLCATSL